jgi:hypothetical protein
LSQNRDSFIRSSYFIALTALDILETLREEVFLCTIPLEEALVSSTSAAFKLASAAALSPDATAASTFFVAVLTADLTALFLSSFFLDVRILFFADLMLANLFSSVFVRACSEKHFPGAAVLTDR